MRRKLINNSLIAESQFFSPKYLMHEMLIHVHLIQKSLLYLLHTSTLYVHCMQIFMYTVSLMKGVYSVITAINLRRLTFTQKRDWKPPTKSLRKPTCQSLNRKIRTWSFLSWSRCCGKTGRNPRKTPWTRDWLPPDGSEVTGRGNNSAKLWCQTTGLSNWFIALYRNIAAIFFVQFMLLCFVV